MTKIFITFGGGGQNYIDAGVRLVAQMEQLKLFDAHYLYTDEWLMNNKEFWDKHKDFMTNPANKRGYGFWLWKPYIIKKSMEKMKDGDTLLYLDAGCEPTMSKRNKMIECMNVVKNDLIVGSLSPPPSEIQHTKMDLIVYMNMLMPEHLKSKQRQGGTNMFYVCPKTRALVNMWYDISCEQNYHLIDDTPSKLPETKYFVQHRRDQSIFSLLTKKYGIYSKRCNLCDAIYIERNISIKPRH